MSPLGLCGRWMIKSNISLRSPSYTLQFYHILVHATHNAKVLSFLFICGKIHKSGKHTCASEFTLSKYCFFPCTAKRPYNFLLMLRQNKNDTLSLFVYRLNSQFFTNCALFRAMHRINYTRIFFVHFKMS